jgi:predicted GNAT family acetyltransferase
VSDWAWTRTRKSARSARIPTSTAAVTRAARGRTPFLHVSHQNHRAESLYEQMGYGQQRDIGFWSLRRVPA